VGGAPGPLTDLFSLGACAFTAMTGRIPFEGDVLGEIVLRVCAAPMPIPSQVNPSVPVGFDAWFARACARDPQRRFQTAIELADALAAVVGLGSVKLATLDEDQVQYVLRPRANSEVGELSSIPPATSMSPRTALLAGLVIGVTLMVGAIGFFAWREKMKAEEAEAAASARPSASAAPPSATSSVAPPAASTAETVVDAGKRDAKAK
jgi:serine/threonine-protein kinase